MKLNIAYPATGCQKKIEIEDENTLRVLYDKRVSHEIDGEHLGDEFKGYVLKIAGGNDKQGFPLKNGVLTPNRVKLFMGKGVSCYRPRRRGERKRKSVRGCIVSQEISVLNMVIVKKGDAEIPGLTDTIRPRRLGPKRASKIRRLFDLSKEDSVTAHVIRRQITTKNGKTYSKAPNVQRLITPERLQRKRRRKAIKRQRWVKSKQEAEAYQQLLNQRMKEARDKRQARIAKRRSVSKRQSEKK